MIKEKRENGVINGIRNWVKKEFFLFKMGEIIVCFYVIRNYVFER